MADTLLSAGYLPAPAAGEDPAVSDCALLNLSPPDETKASALRDAGFRDAVARLSLRPTRFARGATRRRVGGHRRGRCRGPIGRRGRRRVVLPGWRAGAVVAKTLEARLAEYPTAAEEDEDALRAYREELAAMAKATGEAGGRRRRRRRSALGV